MKTQVLFILISIIGIKSLFGNDKNGSSLLAPKHYTFIYYPKYQLYYALHNKNWYQIKGCTWIVSRDCPKDLSRIKLFFAKSEVVNCKSTVPFCLNPRKINREIDKKEVLNKQKKQVFIMTIRYQNKKGNLPMNSKTVYKSGNYNVVK